jgi:serralysin
MSKSAFYLATGLALFLSFGGAKPSANAAFHLWQVKEVFTNADGSVQFVEMFDSSPGETSVGGFSLTASSDGNIKTFTFPSDLSHATPGSLLLATTGFGSLPGGVTPDFTFDQGGVSGMFFNPSAANLTFVFDGSNDSIGFTGALLPKNGINSLTDTNLYGPKNLVSGVNSPTNLNGTSGSVNLAVPEPVAGLLLLMAVPALSMRRRR